MRRNRTSTKLIFAASALLWLAHCGTSAEQPDVVQYAGVQGSTTSGIQDGNAVVQDGNTLATTTSLSCPGDANDTYAADRIACVEQINAYRSSLGLAPFGRWCGEATCIDRQASTDSAQDTAHSAFGSCRELAQNECPNWPTPVQSSLIKCLAQMWAEGPGTDFSTHGHYINMTSQTYTQVECGVAVAGDSFWGAMDFH